MSVSNIVAGNEKPKNFEFKRLGYRIVLVVSADGLLCNCLYEPSAIGNPITSAEIREYLSESKIREGIDEGAIAALLAKAEAREKISDIVIARGTPMIPGKDSWFDFGDLYHLSSTEQEELNDDSAQVDLRNVQNIINVSTGQLIGTVILPGKGTAGMTVFGFVIPERAGQELVLQLGKNVRLADDGLTVHAEADGRVFYRGGELSVEDIYTVKGNVDFKVGNITYNGFLEVKGDVLDGFSINVNKGIKIAGNIGACKVETENDMFFCGMAGQNKGLIRCKGNITANFIHDTKIECEGNVIVETEIRNCDIKALGIVRVNKGVLVGGNCVAMGGVEASTVGSPASVSTKIIVGSNYHDLDELNQLFEQMKQLIAKFQESSDRSNNEELMKQRAVITKRIQELRSRTYENANPKVNVKKWLYEKSNITFETIAEEIKEEHPGPLSMIYNSIEGGVRYLPMTNLSTKAAEIEQFFIQEAERAAQANSEEQ